MESIGETSLDDEDVFMSVRSTATQEVAPDVEMKGRKKRKRRKQLEYANFENIGDVKKKLKQIPWQILPRNVKRARSRRRALPNV